MTDLDHKVNNMDGAGSQPHGQARDTGNMRYLWKIPIDMFHIKSLCGILEAAIAILSLIAWISCETGRTFVCDYKHGSTYRFFSFIAGSTCLTCILWWIFNVVTLNQRIRVWRLGELIILGVFGILYVSGCLAIAINDCRQDSNRVAAAFGFFSVFAMGVHFYLSFRVWRETESPSALRSQQREKAEEEQPY